MAILTKSGVATFGATSVSNIRINWSESVDTSSITSSAPYGVSTITINSIEAYSYNLSVCSFVPGFTLSFGGNSIVSFSTVTADYYAYISTTKTWTPIKKVSNNTNYATTFYYTRKSLTESPNFTITKNGWTYPGFYVSTASFQSIGGGASDTWNAGAALSTLYTNPTAPSGVYLAAISKNSMKNGGYYYYKPGGKTRLYWSAGTDGTNNPIETYKIYISENGGPYYDTTATSNNTETINGSTYYYIDVGGSNLSRGEYQTYKIVAKGKYSNSAQSTTASPRLYMNRLPNKPKITGPDVVASTVAESSVTYTAGTDKDNQTVYVYYSQKPNGTKNIYSEEALAVDKTYYFWSYDGLEFSENYTTHKITKDSKAPTMLSYNSESITFSPYYNNKNYKYVEKITFSDFNATHGDSSSIALYNLYYSQSSDATIDTTTTKAHITTIDSSSTSYTFTVSSKISAGYYFKVGISATTTLGEESEIVWKDITFCRGRAITSSDFLPTMITIDSTIDNNRNKISDSTNISGYFNNYIQINWTNPSITSPRYGITKIECGIISSTSSFTAYSLHDYSGSSTSPLCSFAEANEGYLYLSTLSRGSEITPAIRVWPENGTAFIISSNVKRTRTTELSFSGNYSVIPSTGWEFFKNKSSYIKFTGNKIRGDADFATISKTETKVSFTGFTEKTYACDYTVDDSSVPGNITFIDKEENGTDTVIVDLENTGKDSVVTVTYAITVTDRYGNTASTTVRQSIDFRIEPVWTSEAKITTSIIYNDKSSVSNISSIADIAKKILNPNDQVIISWNKSQITDGGNGNVNNITYKIKRYEINEVSKTEELKASGGNLVETLKIGAEDVAEDGEISYKYTAPYGNTVPRAIYFEVYGIDDSGLETNTPIISTDAEVLVIGRSIAPSFDVYNYKLAKNEGSGEATLTGTLSITDYGDSRDINSSWANYDRLGLTLEATISGKVSSMPITDAISNIELGGYTTPSNKQTIAFRLYPNYISTLSTTKNYLYSIAGPTFSYRNHQIGINAKADIYGDSVFAIAAADKKDKIYFISNSPDLEDIYLNLIDGKIYNLIIDCGEW